MITVPNFEEPGLTDFLVRVLTERERVESQLLSRQTANNSVLLYSPSLKVYEIKVSDAGAISATLVSG
jgi:hypothetical protein